MGSCTTKSVVYEGKIVRIALLGDSVSGKSAILSRFASNKFSLNYTHNTKSLAAIKSYLADESSKPITIEIWEVQTELMVKVDMAIILVDATKAISEIQDNYWKWLQVATEYGCKNIHFALTKADLNEQINESYVNKVHEALALTENQKVFVTSSLLNTGTDAMIKTIALSKWH